VNTRWNEAQHPRGPLGRFVEVSQAHTEAQVNDWLAQREGLYRAGLVPTMGIEEDRRYAASLRDRIRNGVVEIDPDVSPEAEEMGNEWGVGFPTSRIQDRARMAYTGDPSINQYLRTGDQGIGSQQAEVFEWESEGQEELTVAEAAEHLSATMRPSERPMTLYRGIEEGNRLDGVMAGDTITDAGFSSTSLDREIAGDYGRVMTIRAPRGTRAAVGFVDHEEVILDRGTSFRVVRVTPKSVQVVPIQSKGNR
jgi:hypothetical protein